MLGARLLKVSMGRLIPWLLHFLVRTLLKVCGRSAFRTLAGIGRGDG
jgi:hypothetical protein